jgi:hypothetical protein
MILIFKKESNWVQPTTIRGEGSYPEITFNDILIVTKTIEEMQVNSWSDIDRLDVRPKKGMVKIRAKNGWELQVDTKNRKILNLDYRRSDIIEAIHDGTFFHKYISLGVFFPSAVILLILWVTGIYLFINITITKSRNKRNKKLFSKSFIKIEG